MNRTPFALLLAALLPAAMAAEPTPTLKDVFRDHFLVGTALNRSHVGGAPFRRTPEQVASEVALVKAQFNQVTAENDMKWQLIHPREGRDGYDFTGADALVDFAVSNRMEVVGHTLVWHSQTPNWVFAGTNPAPVVPKAVPSAPTNSAVVANAGTNSTGTNASGRPRPGPGFGGGFGRYDGPRASREELLARMREHIHTVVGRYKGRVKTWDVVNEAIADGNGTNVLRSSLWSEIIGPDFIAHAFRFAHEADPAAVLRYNDYSLENPVKRAKLLTLVRSLKEQGVPIHAIGSQAHVNVGMTFETMDQTLSELASLGLPIHITELDVNGAQGGQRTTGADVSANAAATQGGLVSDADKRLADAYAGIFRAFLKHRQSVRMVTLWGVNDAVSWRANGKPLPFDGDNRPKPAFEAILSTAKELTPTSR
jgi:endo-1,4-beta-xylanase